MSWPPLGDTLNDFGGDWSAYLGDCYSRYQSDFHNGPLPWPVGGQSLNVKRQPRDEQGRCNTFWHLVTEGDIEDERLPDLGRLERIDWPMAILREFNSIYPQQSSEKVCWWMNTRGRDARYVLAVSDFSYVVVVADRRTYVLLWTAYPIDRAHRRAKLRREYETYWRSVEMARAASE